MLANLVVHYSTHFFFICSPNHPIQRMSLRTPKEEMTRKMENVSPFTIPEIPHLYNTFSIPSQAGPRERGEQDDFCGQSADQYQGEAAKDIL